VILSQEDDPGAARCIACQLTLSICISCPAGTARARLAGPAQGQSPAREAPDPAPLDKLLIRGIRHVRIYLRRRRACLPIAPTYAANAIGSMTGMPRHGGIDS
jgi:hypothetical protein